MEPNRTTAVEKLPAPQRQQWMWIASKALEDGKPGDEAIRAANAVVKKAYDAFEVEADDDAFTAAAAKDYQYVESYEYESRKVSQEEADYNPSGGTINKACSSCFFFVSPARCTVVAGTIAPNGLSNQWRAVPVYTLTPIPVVVVDLQSVKAGAATEPEVLIDQTVQLTKPSLLDKAASWLTGVKRGLPDTATGTGFRVVKQADGSLRWFSRYSNSWKDNDHEIITQAAHKEYVEWASTKEAYPELWLWHTAGTRFGQADWLDFSDGFACASGTIDDTPQAKAAVEFLSNQELGVSHGFLQVKEGNLITKYRTFEISPLPLKRAAVWTTNFGIIGKETEMGFTKEKREFLVGALGESAVAKLEGDTAASVKQLKDLGIEFKSLEQPDAPAAPPAATEAPPAATAAVNDAGYKALAGLVADAVGAVTSLAGQVAELKASVTAVKATDDDKIADAFVAKVLAAANARPSESADNLTNKEAAGEAAPTDDFFGSQILKDFGIAAKAPTGPGTAAAGSLSIQ